MKWLFDNDRPIYQQIVEHLEKAVISGDYKPGEKLPSVRELAADAGVNPNTMQRALTDLEIQSIFISKRTSGRFVTQDKEKIKNMRDNIAGSYTCRYLHDMRELAYNNDEIFELIRRNIS